MREFMRLGSQLVRTWWFWAFVLLAVPNCGLSTHGLCSDGSDGSDGCPGDPPPCEGPQCDCNTAPDCPPTPPNTDAFIPGDQPISDAIQCDFPMPEANDNSDCATAQEVANHSAISDSEGAIFLAVGQDGPVMFDWSTNSKAKCGGLPRKVTFLSGNTPTGATLCINFNQQVGAGKTYTTPYEACAAKCQDLVTAQNIVVPGNDPKQYCFDNAHVSTNFPKNGHYAGACTSVGMPDASFFDPRKKPELLVWETQSKIGVDDMGGTNTIQRTAGTTGNTLADFNAGAASDQIVETGDAWIEFEVGETGVAHLLGFHTSPCITSALCPDMDPSANMGFGLNLSADMPPQVYVVENGTFIGPFGTYAANQRYRIHATDNHDGSATISYNRLTNGFCSPGQPCAEDPPFYTSLTHLSYPLRVDASLRDQNAQIANVTLMRIFFQ